MHPKTLHLHSAGPQVHALQILLRKYKPELVADGKFGPKTEQAVRTAQRKLGLFPADGLAGPRTLAALTKADAPSAMASPSIATLASDISAGLAAMASHAGAAMIAAGHGALASAEQASRAIEAWISGSPQPEDAVPPSLRHFVPVAKAKAPAGTTATRRGSRSEDHVTK